jgi:hypothetical protein
MLFRIFDIGGTLLVAPFVVSARPLDLLLCAKHLFVAANVAGIQRTEIDRSATGDSHDLGGSRVPGHCPTSWTDAQGATPARLKAWVENIHDQKSRKAQGF